MHEALYREAEGGESMTYYDFFMGFERIALDHGLRLVMTRAPFGCGFLFGFSENGKYSKTAVLLMNHVTPEELFSDLEEIAEEFKKEIADGS